MAGPVTHMLVSQAASDPTVVTTIDRKLQGILIKWQPFLLLGSVGPDLPAIMDKLEKQEMSNRLHDGRPPSGASNAPWTPTNTSACGMYSALRGTSPDSAQVAFLMGYVAHTITDVLVHPIVNEVAGDPEHRNCETVQDTLLFHDYTGQNIKKDDYFSWLKLCNGRPDDRDATLELWQSILDEHYGDYSCRAWMVSYNKSFCIAREVFHIDGWSYPAPTQVTAQEVRRYYSQVKLPPFDGPERFGHFRKDVFTRAVHMTAQAWQQIYQRFMDPQDEGGIENVVRNWDLNKGDDLTTGRVADLWRAP